MSWVVRIIPAAEAELSALPEDMQARFRRIVEMIQSFGLERMREPYVKHLQDGLWEMRLTGRDGISRAIYVTRIGRRVVVVRAFIKKTEKTPPSELRIARQRAKEVQ